MTKDLDLRDEKTAELPGTQAHLWIWGRRVIRAMVAAITLACLAGLLSPVDSLFELAIHGVFHLLVASLVLLPVVWWVERWLVWPVLGSIFLCTVTFQPWIFWVSPSPRDDLENEITVMSWNVLASNRRRKEAARVIEAADPDVLVLIEPQPNFTEEMDFLGARYDQRLEMPGWGGGGLNVYSKVAGTQFRSEDFGNRFQPAIVATVPGSNGKRLELVSIHTLSPLPRYRAKIRDEQLRLLGEWSEAQTGPVVTCGDMNVTPWAPAFRTLVRRGFVDSRLGAGNCASWPSQWGSWGIPIDHALSLGNCQILDRRVLEEAPGSDHRPITFRVRF